MLFPAHALTIPASEDTTGYLNKLTSLASSSASLQVDSSRGAFLYFNLDDIPEESYIPPVAGSKFGSKLQPGHFPASRTRRLLLNHDFHSPGGRVFHQPSSEENNPPAGISSFRRGFPIPLGWASPNGERFPVSIRRRIL
jgi:hypothetical protein